MKLENLTELYTDDGEKQWCGDIQEDGTFVAQVRGPVRGSELFKVRVTLDKDKEYSQIVSHDLTEENLGYVLYEVVKDYESESLVKDVKELYNGGNVAKWIIRQIQGKLENLK